MFNNFNKFNNKKAERPIIGVGTPAPNEGIDGDFRLQETPTGLKLYIKFNEQWTAFSPDSETNTKKSYILSGGFTSTTTSEAYWDIYDSDAVDTSLSATGADNDECLWLAPFNGRVESIFIRGTVASGSTVFKIYKAVDADASATTLIGNETLDLARAHTTYNVGFPSSDFSSGEGLSFSHHQSGSGPGTTTWTIFIERTEYL